MSAALVNPERLLLALDESLNNRVQLMTYGCSAIGAEKRPLSCAAHTILDYLAEPPECEKRQCL